MTFLLVSVEVRKSGLGNSRLGVCSQISDLKDSTGEAKILGILSSWL
jgi:hypothetical protein